MAGEREMAYLLAGILAGLMSRPETRSLMREYHVLKHDYEPEVILRFSESHATYRLHVAYEGFPNDAGIERLLGRDETD